MIEADTAVERFRQKLEALVTSLKPKSVPPSDKGYVSGASDRSTASTRKRLGGLRLDKTRPRSIIKTIPSRTKPKRLSKLTTPAPRLSPKPKSATPVKPAVNPFKGLTIGQLAEQLNTDNLSSDSDNQIAAPSKGRGGAAAQWLVSDDYGEQKLTTWLQSKIPNSPHMHVTLIMPLVRDRDSRKFVINCFFAQWRRCCEALQHRYNVLKSGSKTDEQQMWQRQLGQIERIIHLYGVPLHAPIVVNFLVSWHSLLPPNSAGFAAAVRKFVPDLVQRWKDDAASFPDLGLACPCTPSCAWSFYRGETHCHRALRIDAADEHRLLGISRNYCMRKHHCVLFKKKIRRVTFDLPKNEVRQLLRSQPDLTAFLRDRLRRKKKSYDVLAPIPGLDALPRLSAPSAPSPARPNPQPSPSRSEPARAAPQQYTSALHAALQGGGQDPPPPGDDPDDDSHHSDPDRDDDDDDSDDDNPPIIEGLPSQLTQSNQLQPLLQDDPADAPVVNVTNYRALLQDDVVVRRSNELLVGSLVAVKAPEARVIAQALGASPIQTDDPSAMISLRGSLNTNANILDTLHSFVFLSALSCVCQSSSN